MGCFYNFGNLLDFIKDNSAKYPFHMPGHKRNPAFLTPLLDNAAADITEIPGADNMLVADGAIGRLRERLAENSNNPGETLISVNGSSAGVLAALLAVSKDGDTVIAAGGAHRSFISAMELSGARPVYIAPKDTGLGFSGSVPLGGVSEALAANKGAKAVFVTSPTYEGIVSDIAGIAEIAHKSGALLIVDEAHGAHFFGGYFPKSAITLGADIVIQSLHKTLPALTPTAVVHIGGDSRLSKRVGRALCAVTTTSPSYMALAQLEYMADMIERDGKDLLKAHAERISGFREFAKALCNIRLIEKADFAEGDVYDLDPARLVLMFGEAKRISQELDKRFGLVVEAAFEEHIICITTIADTDEGFGRLEAALRVLDNETKPPSCAEKALPPIPPMALTPREALAQDRETVTRARAIGRICAAIYAPYPPGAPILAPGEIITKEALEYIDDARIEVLSE